MANSMFCFSTNTSSLKPNGVKISYQFVCYPLYGHVELEIVLVDLLSSSFGVGSKTQNLYGEYSHSFGHTNTTTLKRLFLEIEGMLD